jgi:hypothetical protein
LILAAIGGLALFLFILMPTNAIDNQNPARQAEMIALTLEWGRLAPFSETAYNFSIHTEGNMFTRSFRASFSAPEEDIRKWVAESPGLQEAAIDLTPEGKQRYSIQPGGGANLAEVTIDFKSCTVEIYVSWS